MNKHKHNLKFKVCSEHKPCSFCGAKNVPVIMEMRTGKAICQPCIDYVAAEMNCLSHRVIIGGLDGNQPDAAI